MKTNREWLNELAANDVDALQAWFDAEHVDAQRDNNGTCPIGNGTASDDAHSKAHSKTEPLLTEQSELLSDEADTREKLECEVRIISEINEDDEKRRRLFEDMIINLLDRQATIARSECDMPNWEYCETCETLAELQAKVNELTDSYEASSRANEILTLENGQVKTENAKLQAQVDELTQKLDNLAHDLKESERFREELREELSVAYDHAHDLLARRDRGLA